MPIIQLTLSEAVEKLHAAGMAISKESLSAGLKQGAFDFGVAYDGQRGGVVIQIYNKLLDKWIAERNED